VPEENLSQLLKLVFIGPTNSITAPYNCKSSRLLDHVHARVCLSSSQLSPSRNISRVETYLFSLSI